MTLVHIDLRNPALGAATPQRVVWAPSRRLQSTTHVVLPEPVRVDLVAGQATVTLIPTNSTDYPGEWAWRATEYGLGDGHTRYLLVPNTNATLQYSALTEVDPDTLDPEAEPEAAWWAEVDRLNELIGSLGDIEGALGALQKSANLSDLTNVGQARANLVLDNVNNTSDANKPISTATATALSAKQPLHAALTALAALAPANDDVIQRKGGTWVNRTMPQVKADLALTKSDVGLGAVDNTTDANKPISVATQTALNAKQDANAEIVTITQLSPANNDVLQRKAGAWTNRSPAQLKADLALSRTDVGLGNVDNTTDAGKPISTATQTALDGKVGTSDSRLTDARTPVNHANSHGPTGNDQVSLSAGQIVTGNMGVARGGTGLGTVAAGSYLKGNGTSSLVPRTTDEVKTDLGLATAAADILLRRRTFVHNGTAYVLVAADEYYGPVDPGAVPDGTFWGDTSEEA